MCFSCLRSETVEEGHDTVDVTPLMRLCVIRIHTLYNDTPHCTGGGLHLVLDDMNLEDRDIQWCLGRVRAGTAWYNDDNDPYFPGGVSHDVLCLDIAQMLLQMSTAERAVCCWVGPESPDSFPAGLTNFLAQLAAVRVTDRDVEYLPVRP